MTTLYGIKNCDTVKKAQKYLTDKGVEFNFHDFRVEGIDEAMVNTFIQELGLDKVINKRSTTWKQLSQEQRGALDEQNAVALCVENPTLIKRPVLKLNNAYHIGFKASDYDSLI